MEDLYYIQCVGYQGNCLIFWAVDGHGYTCNLNEAWKVPKAKAINICKDRPKQDIPHLAKMIDSIAVRHVNCEDFRKL